MFHLIKEVRDIKRFNQILVVLFEEGFAYWISKIKLKHHVPIVKRIKENIKKSDYVKPEVRLRRVLEKLGPTFIKLGQLLSVRPDLIPTEFCKELEKLQDNVPPFSYNEVKSIVEKEFEKNLNDIFLSFEKKPIASASISQVHKAVLKNGNVVAVKVQRPNAKRLMETDIEIMLYFANLLDKYVENLRRFNPPRIVNEFREWTEKELDFRLEGRNALRFYNNFKGSKTVYIPKIFENFVTEKVLTLEYIDGIELHNLNEVKKKKINFSQIIRNGFEAVMTQVFVHGIFHADPHPGNIIVMKDNKIAFVDFGIVGYFDEKLRNNCIDFVYGIVEQNEEIVLNTLLSMGMTSYDINYEELKADISYIIQPLYGSSVREIKLSKVLEEILSIALKHRLRMPAALVLFGKTIITLEGIALQFDPNFKIIDTTRPFIEEIIKKRSSPKYILKNFVYNMTKYRKLLEDFPEKAENVLNRIQRGTIKVDIADTDIKKLSIEIDRSSNRIAFGLLIAALLITSSILIQVEKGPKILGIPFLSFFSFLFASMLTFILFISIVKEKMRHI